MIKGNWVAIPPALINCKVVMKFTSDFKDFEIEGTLKSFNDGRIYLEEHAGYLDHEKLLEVKPAE